MFVIEGQSGKSKFIQEMLSRNKSRTLILDAVGVNSLIVKKGSVHYMMPAQTTFTEIEEFLAVTDLTPFINVILLINTHKNNLHRIKNLTLKFPKLKFIVTIQTDSERINTYEW